MQSKTGSNLIRQTLTRFWQYNMYVQKPFDTGSIFISIFKIYSIIEIFLIFFRPSKLNMRNIRIHNLIKTATHRLMEPSILRLVSSRICKNEKNITLFCNLGSRTYMYPESNQLIKFKNLHFKFKKKLNIFKYTFFLLQKRIYTNYFSKNYYNLFQIQKFGILNKLLKKFNYLQKCHIFLKNKNRLLFFKNKNNDNKLINTVQTLKINRRIHTELLRWSFDTKILNRLVLRSLKKQIPHLTKEIKYKNNYFYQKNNYFFFKKKLMLLLFYLNSYNMLKKKNYFLKLLSIFKLFLNLNYKNKIQLSKKKNELFIQNFNYKLTNIFSFKIQQLIYPFLIQNEKSQKNYNISFWKSNVNFKKKNILKFFEISNLVYTQFFNKSLEHKFNYFSAFFLFQKDFKIIFQQLFSFPKSVFLLKTLNKQIQDNTGMVRHNKKFYTNFLNIMPILQNFIAIQILAKQIAIELSRTKKHWRVIRGIEMIIMQSFIQLKKDPVKSKSNFIGLRITITGRPNKISRTKRIVFQYGRITKASFIKYNITESFASANAQIGSFGITILAAT